MKRVSGSECRCFFVNRRHGFTFAETALATLLVGILVVAAMQSFAASFQTHHFAQSRIQAVFLAEQLVAELTTLPWSEPGQTSVTIGRETGETTGIVRRNQLDDMDDFDNWTETPSQRDGTVLVGTGDLKRSVTIVNISEDDFETPVRDNLDTGLRRIIVTVSDSAGETARCSTLLSRAELSLRASVFEQPGVPNDN